MEQVRLVHQALVAPLVLLDLVDSRVFLVHMVLQEAVDVMELMELQGLVDVQEALVLMEQLEHQLHQDVVVHQEPLGQVEQVEVVDVVVQEVHQVQVEQVLHQQAQEHQLVQDLQELQEAQDYLVIDIEQLLQLHLH